MSVPTIFGYPLWGGKIKRRVAKKYLNRWRLGKLINKLGLKYFDLKEGDLVNDCTGFNGSIIEIEPYYHPVGRAMVMVDVDLTTSNTGCSLIHCGVCHPLSREEIEKQTLSFLENWTFGEPGKKWYGDLDAPENREQITQARKKLDILKSGGHITDEQGVLLPEFK